MCEEVQSSCNLVISDSVSDISDSDLSDSDISELYSSPDSEDEEFDCGDAARDSDAAAGKELSEDGKTHTKVPGVVFLSHMSPYLRHNLRGSLYPYGSLGRIYLQPRGMSNQLIIASY